MGRAHAYCNQLEINLFAMLRSTVAVGAVLRSSLSSLCLLILSSPLVSTQRNISTKRVRPHCTATYVSLITRRYSWPKCIA